MFSITASSNQRKARVIVYARVSMTDDSQTVDNQTRELEQWVQSQGDRVEVVARLSDKQSTRDTRPSKEQALKLLRTRRADTVVFWSLDRWGRTMRELVLEFDEAIQRGWTFISLREGIALDTAAGKLMAHVLGAMANFERDRISERTKAGMARAKAGGQHVGRPSKAMLKAGWRPKVAA